MKLYEEPIVGVTIDAVKSPEVRYMKIASLVIEEGVEARTIHLCNLCLMQN